MRAHGLGSGALGVEPPFLDGDGWSALPPTPPLLNVASARPAGAADCWPCLLAPVPASSTVTSTGTSAAPAVLSSPAPPPRRRRLPAAAAAASLFAAPLPKWALSNDLEPLPAPSPSPSSSPSSDCLAGAVPRPAATLHRQRLAQHRMQQQQQQPQQHTNLAHDRQAAPAWLQARRAAVAVLSAALSAASSSQYSRPTVYAIAWIVPGAARRAAVEARSLSTAREGGCDASPSALPSPAGASAQVAVPADACGRARLGASPAVDDAVHHDEQARSMPCTAARRTASGGGAAIPNGAVPAGGSIELAVNGIHVSAGAREEAGVTASLPGTRGWASRSAALAGRARLASAAGVFRKSATDANLRVSPAGALISPAPAPAWCWEIGRAVVAKSAYK